MNIFVALKDKAARISMKNATLLIHEESATKIKEDLKVETLDNSTIETYFNQYIATVKPLEYLLVD